jgi:hypothetical protein
MSTQTGVATPMSTQEREALLARIAHLEAKMEAKSVNDGSVVKLTVPNGKGSEGGSLSMYGLGRYPVTLTFTQWLIVAKQLPKLLAFAAANFTKLYFKSTEQHDAAMDSLKLCK